MIEEALGADNDSVESLGEGWWEATLSVPAYRFYTWLCELPGCDTILTLISRDIYDRTYAVRLLNFVRSRGEVVRPERPLSKLTGFADASYPLDTVCVINSSVHNQFSSELNRRTFVAFPADESEFSGDEDAATAVAQHRLVEAIDWRHKLHPKALAAFPKRRPQGRYRGPKRVPYNMKTLFWNLRLLPQSTGGKLAYLTNFRGESCVIEAAASTYLVEGNAGSPPLTGLTWDAAKAWVWDFLAPGRPLGDDLARTI